MANLLDTLKQRPVLGDGGMGTQLIERGLTQGSSSEAWNVDNPEAVKEVHAAYRAAGSELITSNTFQGTTTALAMHGLDSRADELNRAGAANAKAVAEGAWVLGDCGPFGGFLEPLGDVTEAQLTDIFKQQFTALREGGADVALVETMSDPTEVAVAIKAAKAVADWPVIATYAFQRSGDRFTTMMGTTVAAAMQQAIDAGADIVGANCGTALDLDAYLTLARELVDGAGDTPVIIQPNAGAPQQSADGVHYPATPDDMAALVPQLLDIGVRIIGGCCGTTPAHLRAMSTAIKEAAQ